jgi:hypothetical protein
MGNIGRLICTLATLLIAVGSFAGGANAAVQVTTSGAAITSNVSLSLNATFLVTTAGTMDILRIGSFTEDSNRDAVRFTGVNQLTISINNVVFASTFQDFNDGGGRPGIGNSLLPYLDENSWVFIGGAQSVVPGDTVRISGTASGGTFSFGNSASTFSLLPSGSYNVGLFSTSSGTLLAAQLVQAPEPGTLAFLALGGTLVLVKRRRLQ